MSDKIVVMQSGEILQIGSPTDIYNEPKNRFVANFIGESNIIDGIMKADKRVMFLSLSFRSFICQKPVIPGFTVQILRAVSSP